MCRAAVKNMKQEGLCIPFQWKCYWDQVLEHDGRVRLLLLKHSGDTASLTRANTANLTVHKNHDLSRTHFNSKSTFAYASLCVHFVQYCRSACPHTHTHTHAFQQIGCSFCCYKHYYYVYRLLCAAIIKSHDQQFASKAPSFCAANPLAPVSNTVAIFCVSSMPLSSYSRFLGFRA